MLECQCPRAGHSSSQSATSNQQKVPVMKIPIISIDDFVPVPGQNFALRIQNFRDIALLRRIYRTDHKTLGLLPLKFVILKMCYLCLKVYHGWFMDCLKKKLMNYCLKILCLLWRKFELHFNIYYKKSFHLVPGQPQNTWITAPKYCL